jgi:hypothetical protein
MSYVLHLFDLITRSSVGAWRANFCGTNRRYLRSQCEQLRSLGLKFNGAGIQFREGLFPGRYLLGQNERRVLQPKFERTISELAKNRDLDFDFSPHSDTPLEVAVCTPPYL